MKKNSSPSFLTPNFQALFESAPGLYLVLTPDLNIVAVSDFISYRSPEMQLMQVFQLPETPCALAVVTWSAHLTGVQKERALVMCPEERGAPVKPKK